MKNLLISLALLVGVTVNAAEGYVTKTASGVASATAIFPAATLPMTLKYYDVTSDTNAGAFSYATATYATNASLLAAASSAKTLIIPKGTDINVNSNLVIQSIANDTCFEWTPTTNEFTTNALITLRYPFATNVTAGDAVYKRYTSAMGVLRDAAVDATLYYVDSKANITDNQYLMLDRGDGAKLKIQQLTTVATVAATNLTCYANNKQAVPTSTTVYMLTGKEKTTTTARVATDTTLVVASTLGLCAADDVLVVRNKTTGNLAIVTVSSTNGTTYTLTGQIGMAVPTGSRIYALADSTYTTSLPTTVNEDYISVTSCDTLAAKTNILVATTVPFFARIKSIAAAPVYTLTMGTTFGTACGAGAKIYGLTNGTTATFGIGKTNTQGVIVSSTAYASGDTVVVKPTNGDIFQGILDATPASYRYQTLSSTALGTAVAVGDKIFIKGAASSTTVGNATLRQTGDLYHVAGGKPLVLNITGNTTCSINAATVRYGN